MYIIDIHPKYQQGRPSLVPSPVAWPTGLGPAPPLSLPAWTSATRRECSINTRRESVHLPLFLCLFRSPCPCPGQGLLHIPALPPPVRFARRYLGIVPRYSPQPCSTCQSNFDHLVCLVRNGSNLWHCILVHISTMFIWWKVTSRLQ
jgi:hypothetical protein